MDYSKKNENKLELNDFPVEMITEVVSRIKNFDLLNSSTVSKKFYTASFKHKFWKDRGSESRLDHLLKLQAQAKPFANILKLNSIEIGFYGLPSIKIQIIKPDYRQINYYSKKIKFANTNYNLYCDNTLIFFSGINELSFETSNIIIFCDDTKENIDKAFSYVTSKLDEVDKIKKLFFHIGLKTSEKICFNQLDINYESHPLSLNTINNAEQLVDTIHKNLVDRAAIPQLYVEEHLEQLRQAKLNENDQKNEVSP